MHNEVKQKNKKSIYILLMQTYTGPAKMIKLFSRYEYSHVAISLNRDCNITYSFGRKSLHNVLKSGFIIEYKDGDFFRYFNKTRCKIFELKVTNKQYERVKKILDEMVRNKEKYKYDFVGLVARYYFRIPITFKNRYVCSSFVASVLKEARVYDFDKKPSYVKPKDFLNIEEMNEIYMGSYSGYNNE